MPRIQRIPCPLCRVPTRISAIGNNGCPTCADELKISKRERAAPRLEAAIKAQERATLRYKDFIAHEKEVRKKQERVAKEKVIAKKRKESHLLDKEISSVALARRSLLHYVERRKPDYRAAWGHELIAGELERFMHDVQANKHPRLILVVSSRFGKSELASNSFPAWVLGHHPDWEILLASASDALPAEFSRNIREQLRSPDYHKIFPSGGRLRTDSSAALRWNTEQGGGIKAIGQGGVLLGFGFKVGIFDDIHRSMEEVENPERNLSTWEWFSSIAYSRQLPGAGIIVIAQRMHDQDLIGRLMKRQEEDEARVAELREEARLLAEDSPEGYEDPYVKGMLEEAEEMDSSMDRWRVVEFPALAKQDEYFNKDTYEIEKYPPNMQPDKPNMRLLRRQGEALDPKRYSRHYYLKIKRNNPRHFAAMFQLDPQVDEGAYFDTKLIRRYGPKELPNPKNMNVVCAWDLAIGTKQQNDHTVGIAMAMDHKRRVWLLDRIRGRFGDVRLISDMVIDLHNKWGAAITGIEKTHVEQAMGPILSTKMQERGEYITLAEGKEALKPITDKAVRARTFQGWVQHGLVYVPDDEVWDDYLGILSRFLVSNIDDDTDASAWGAILLNRMPPPVDHREQNVKKRQEEDNWMSFLDEFVSTQSSRSYMES
jgi:predicted phage terminase large subunit-like protein